MDSKIYSLLNQNYDNFYFGYHKIFLGSLIFKGNKIFAFNLLIKIKYLLKLKELMNPSLIFFIAMLNVSPKVFLSLKLINKVKNYIPIIINFPKKIMFAIKWILQSLDNKHKIIKSEIVDLISSSFYSKGLAVKRKQEYYKLAILNKNLIHFYN